MANAYRVPVTEHEASRYDPDGAVQAHRPVEIDDENWERIAVIQQYVAGLLIADGCYGIDDTRRDRLTVAMSPRFVVAGKFVTPDAAVQAVENDFNDCNSTALDFLDGVRPTAANVANGLSGRGAVTLGFRDPSLDGEVDIIGDVWGIADWRRPWLPRMVLAAYDGERSDQVGRTITSVLRNIRSDVVLTLGPVEYEYESASSGTIR